jgi:hypothetical protein
MKDTPDKESVEAAIECSISSIDPDDALTLYKRRLKEDVVRYLQFVRRAEDKCIDGVIINQLKVFTTPHAPPIISSREESVLVTKIALAVEANCLLRMKNNVDSHVKFMNAVKKGEYDGTTE